MDIATISKRFGRAKPDITLRIYADLFQKDDGKAAAAIDAALNRWCQTGANFVVCSIHKSR